MGFCALAAWANRDMTFLSGLFTVLGAKAIHAVVSPHGMGDTLKHDTWERALTFTAMMLVVYAGVSALFLKHYARIEALKKSTADNNAGQDDELALTEAVDNVTGSMGAVTSIVWFSLFPESMQSPLATTAVMLIGACLILILEFAERGIKTGGVVKQVCHMLGTALQGVFAWHAAHAMDIQWRLSWGVPPAALTWGNWLQVVIGAAVAMEFWGWVSAKCLKSKTTKAYGENVFSMIKGAPIKSSHLILRSLVEGQWAAHPFAGASLWTFCCMASLPVFELLRKNTPTCGAEESVTGKIASQTVTLVSHCLGWLCGNLFGDAVIGHIIAAAWFAPHPTPFHRMIFAIVGGISILVGIVFTQLVLTKVADRVFPADEDEEEEDDNESAKPMVSSE